MVIPASERLSVIAEMLPLVKGRKCSAAIWAKIFKCFSVSVSRGNLEGMRFPRLDHASKEGSVMRVQLLSLVTASSDTCSC